MQHTYATLYIAKVPPLCWLNISAHVFPHRCSLRQNTLSKHNDPVQQLVF